MNSFCINDCTGNKPDEVKNCNDKNCPFYPERAADMAWQLERREARKEATKK